MTESSSPQAETDISRLGIKGRILDLLPLIIGPKFRADSRPVRADLEEALDRVTTEVVEGRITEDEAAQRLHLALARAHGSTSTKALAVLSWQRFSERPAPARPPAVRTSTRPKGARREHQTRTAKTSGGQDPGDGDGPADPIAARIAEIVAQAPALSELSAGQQRHLAQLLGGEAK